MFNTISKLVIVTLFVLLLPELIKNINQNYTDNRLRKQRDKVLQTVNALGIKNYIQDGEGYAAYTPIKDAYVSLDGDTLAENLDTIQNEKRKVETDTIEYRILSHNFNVDKKKYLLEIGISLDSVNETTGPLQNIAFEILVGMIILTIIADQLYSNYVLAPLRLGYEFFHIGIQRVARRDDADGLAVLYHRYVAKAVLVHHQQCKAE